MSKKAFMVMPYENDFAERVYKKTIKKLCKSLDIELRRADKIFRPKLVPDILFDEIEEADLVIIDTTDDRPNVFYELGIAHHLDYEKTVIITQNDPDTLPFDIKSFRVVQYKDKAFSLESLEENLLEYIKEILEHSEKQKIRIGLSAYPEMQLINVGKNHGFFENLNIEIVYLPWNEMFTNFNGQGKNVNVVIANIMLYNKWNENHEYSYFICPKTLLAYESFAILVRKELGLKTYSEIRDPKKKKIDIIRETLLQLKDLDIIASNNTDHFESVLKLNSFFDRTIFTRNHVFGSGSPHDCLIDFLEHDQGDAFVGGIPERIAALKTGNIVELITQKNILRNKVDLTQKNGFIIPLKYYSENNQFQRNIDKLISGWESLCKEINVLIANNDYDHDYFKEITEQYNNLIKGKYTVCNTFSNYIDISDLIKIFTEQWLKIL